MKHLCEFSSVTEVPEDVLVEWVFGASPCVGMVLETLGIADTSLIFHQVTKTTLSLEDGPGDVDVLAIPRGDPARATAIECKRVKYQSSAVSSGTTTPNKLGDLEHGAKQANLLWRARFHRVFLMILIEVDARGQSTANFLTRGLSGAQAEFVHSRLDRTRLMPDIGVLCLEIAQPSSRSIDMAGGVGISFSKPATAQPQSPTLTHILSRLK